MHWCRGHYQDLNANGHRGHLNPCPTSDLELEQGGILIYITYQYELECAP